MEVKEAHTEVVDDLLFRHLGKDFWVSSPQKLEEAEPPRSNASLLAVSNKYGVTFFADACGFYASRTSVLLEIAEGLKGVHSKQALAPEDADIVRVAAPRVDVLALSVDELTLAVCSGSSVGFYDVPRLFSKVRSGLGLELC
eukprot:jgi/Mesen1/9636/ME000669S09074